MKKSDQSFSFCFVLESVCDHLKIGHKVRGVPECLSAWFKCLAGSARHVQNLQAMDRSENAKVRIDLTTNGARLVFVPR